MKNYSQRVFVNHKMVCAKISDHQAARSLVIRGMSNVGVEVLSSIAMASLSFDKHNPHKKTAVMAILLCNCARKVH